MHERLIELKDVVFGYDKNAPILNKLDLTITHGKLIAIAGPNGSGKTTLIKHLNGLLKPDSGKVLYKGIPVNKTKHLTEHVGIVFQNPDEQVFFPNPVDDIAFGLRNLGVDEEEIDRRVNEVMSTLKISKLRRRNFFNLSFGEKKKVAFAGILVTSPDIMVLDEPTIGLDPWSRDEFFDLIMEMKKHSTVVVVSHDFEMLKIVDEIHFLWQGKIIDSYDNFDDFKNNMHNIEIEDE